MSEGLDALFNEVNAEPAATPAPEQSGQPRDESGRFASPQPAEPAPAVEPQPVAPVAPAAPEPAKPDPSQEAKGLMLAMLDEREKRQKAERERDELRSSQQTRNIPSVTDDPEAFAQHQQQLIQQTATNTRFETSEIVARQQHGDDPVQKAMDWAMTRSQESPAFAHEYLKQKHPIDWAVRQQKRQALLDEIGDDPEAYKAKILAAHQAAPVTPQQPAVVPQPAPVQPKPATPSPSLAAAPSAGGMATAPTGHGVAFEGAFHK